MAEKPVITHVEVEDPPLVTVEELNAKIEAFKLLARKEFGTDTPLNAETQTERGE